MSCEQFTLEHVQLLDAYPREEILTPSLSTALNIGMIDGGVAANVVAESAIADVAIRIAEGSAEKTRNIVVDAINRVDDRLEVDFTFQGYGPIYIDSDVEGWLSISLGSF